MVTFAKVTNYDNSQAQRPLPWEGVSAWACWDSDAVIRLGEFYPDLVIGEIAQPAGTVAWALRFSEADNYVCHETEDLHLRPIPERFDADRHWIKVPAAGSLGTCPCGCGALEDICPPVVAEWQVLFVAPEESRRLERFLLLSWQGDGLHALRDRIRTALEPVVGTDYSDLDINVEWVDADTAHFTVDGGRQTGAPRYEPLVTVAVSLTSSAVRLVDFADSEFASAALPLVAEYFAQ